jgi:demethylmenaquinone methyltransferase/2-methoxy-6-polyprenyl-1,4-benzoquinol methylase
MKKENQPLNTTTPSSTDTCALTRYYSARAPQYDEVYLKPERQADLREIEQWLPTRFVGADLLEIACGTGYWTQFIARTANSIVAIDAAEETLQIAGERVPDAHVRFTLGDAYAPETGERHCNAAFAGFWFSHVPAQRRAEFVRTLCALLPAGSKVVFIDNRYVEGSSSPIVEHDQFGNTYQLRKLADGSTHQIVKNFPTEDELIASIASAGSEPLFKTWEFFWAVEFTVA